MRWGRRATSARRSCASRRASPSPSTCAWSPSSRECSSPVRSVARRPAPACGALDPVAHAVDGTFQELFVYAERHAHHHEVGDEDADQELRIEDGLIDLEPVSAARWCQRCRSSRCAGPTAPGRALSAACRSRRTRSISTTGRPPMGGPHGPGRTAAHADREEDLRGRSEAEDVALQHPLAPRQSGRRPRSPRRPAPSASRSPSRTWRARRVAPTRGATTASPSAPSTRADPAPMGGRGRPRPVHSHRCDPSASCSTTSPR